MKRPLCLAIQIEPDIGGGVHGGGVHGVGVHGVCAPHAHVTGTVMVTCVNNDNIID